MHVLRNFGDFLGPASLWNFFPKLYEAWHCSLLSHIKRSGGVVQVRDNDSLLAWRRDNTAVVQRHLRQHRADRRLGRAPAAFWPIAALASLTWPITRCRPRHTSTVADLLQLFLRERRRGRGGGRDTVVQELRDYDRSTDVRHGGGLKGFSALGVSSTDACPQYIL